MSKACIGAPRRHMALQRQPIRAGGLFRHTLILVAWVTLASLALLLFHVTPAIALSAAGSDALGSPLQARSQARSSLLEEVLTSGPLGESSDQICRPTGQIADACCDFETVERSLNTPEFFRTLDELVQTNYFRYYKVDLYKDCPFWVDNGLCMNRACGVEKASEEEIPEEYRSQALSDVRPADQSEIVFHSDHAHGQSQGQKNDSCHCSSSDFCHWDDENTSSDAAWVDLIKNPERFTGYAGPGANRVWKAIYEENCFGAVPKGSFIEPPRSKNSGGSGFPSRNQLMGGGGASSSSSSSSNALFGGGGFPGLISSIQAPEDPAANEQCLEKRVFYRVISGLHASISTHICADYLDQETGEWSPNLECFISRISQHPERLQNVYFNYVLLVRALARAGEYLNAFNLKRGHQIPTSEQKTMSLLESLVSQATANPPTFNEASMFHPSNPEASQLRREFKNHFRNISSIMDCVGCDKCRLWGKMQVNGLGTAMKILFTQEGDEAGPRAGGDSLIAKPFDPDSNPAPELDRSELVALINTLHRFAESLKAVETFREMYQSEKKLLQRERKQSATLSKKKPASHSADSSLSPSAAQPPAQTSISAKDRQSRSSPSQSAHQQTPRRQSAGTLQGTALASAQSVVAYLRTFLANIHHRASLLITKAYSASSQDQKVDL